MMAELKRERDWNWLVFEIKDHILPVMDDDKIVNGIFSWRSYGKEIAKGNQSTHVTDAMESPSIVDLNESIFDQATFTKLLTDIRDIRNEVMHFRPAGLNDDKVESLRHFAKFLRELTENPKAKPHV